MHGQWHILFGLLLFLVGFSLKPNKNRQGGKTERTEKSGVGKSLPILTLQYIRMRSKLGMFLDNRKSGQKQHLWYKDDYLSSQSATNPIFMTATWLINLQHLRKGNLHKLTYARQISPLSLFVRSSPRRFIRESMCNIAQQDQTKRNSLGRRRHTNLAPLLCALTALGVIWITVWGEKASKQSNKVVFFTCITLFRLYLEWKSHYAPRWS